MVFIDVDRICKTCGVLKPIECFHRCRGRHGKIYYRHQCRDCFNKSRRQYQKNNRKRVSASNKQHYKNNREKLRQYKKRHYRENRKRILARVKQYREDNPEKRKQYHKDNRDHLSASRKRYYRENRERELTSSKQWKENNPEKNREYNHRRRSLRMNNGGTLTAQDIRMIKTKNTECAICHSAGNLELDHIIPLSLGGRNEPQNIQVLCKHCNSSKQAKLPEGFAKVTAERGA